MLIDIVLYAIAGFLIIYLALNLALYLYLRWYLAQFVRGLKEWDKRTRKDVSAARNESRE